jgi:hypothetical protein
MEDVDSVELNLERGIKDSRKELRGGNNKFAVHRLSTYIFKCENLLTGEDTQETNQFYEENLAELQYTLIRILSSSGNKPSEDKVEDIIKDVETVLQSHKKKSSFSD